MPSYGRSNLILPYSEDTIEKRRARHGTPCHDTLTQIRIHRAAQHILSEGNYIYLRVPRLYDDQGCYIMERVDLLRPLWLGNEDSCSFHNINFIIDVTSELERFWQDMWNEYGFAPWDFQLYVQEDDTVVLLGFDKFGFRHDFGLGSPVALPVPVILDDFFAGDCFPRRFRVGVDWVQQPRQYPSVN